MVNNGNCGNKKKENEETEEANGRQKLKGKNCFMINNGNCGNKRRKTRKQKIQRLMGDKVN